MEEILVALACLNNTGCAETGTEYYRRHAELREAFQRGETEVKRLAGPYAIQIAPVLGLGLGMTASVQLSRKSTVTFRPKDGLMIWSYQWD